jgi:hypothetical protein
MCDTAERTFHEVIILCNLLRSTALLDVCEQGHKDVFGEWLDVGLREPAIVSQTSIVGIADASLRLFLDFDEQYTLDGEGGIRVDDVVV